MFGLTSALELIGFVLTSSEQATSAVVHLVRHQGLRWILIVFPFEIEARKWILAPERAFHVRRFL
jgi:hypothetical protein